MKADKTRKIYVRPFFIGATIVTVLILHFTVSQFFFQEGSARDFSVNELIVEQPVIIKPENEAEKVEAVNVTDTVSPPVKPEPKIEARREVQKETETVNRKKPPRETRAERLRRAERILTGI